MTSLSGASANTTRAFAALFFVEMALSPFIAGFALLVPVLADWGAYKYVPAIVWLLMFLQCLVTFRWRGLWFLLGPPAAFVAIEAYLVVQPAVPKQALQAANSGPGAPSGTKEATSATRNSTTDPPLITRNPDGTLTVQKQPQQVPGDESQKKGQKKGLTIPPQVVVPLTSEPNKR